MIEFLTVLSGLLAGLHSVEFVAAKEVVSGEIYLDERMIQKIESPPWVAELDFGEVLEPHRLEARALDLRGGILGKTSRHINYLPASVGAFLLPLTARWPPDSIRLKYWSLPQEPPVKKQLLLDGDPQRLKEDDTVRWLKKGRDALPEAEELSARVTFIGGQWAEARLRLRPGVQGSSESSSSTRVVLEPENALAGREPPGGVWHDFFRYRGEPLVGAHGPPGLPVLAIVRDPNLSSRLPLGGRIIRPKDASTRSRTELWRISLTVPCEVPTNCPLWFWASSLGEFRLRRELKGVLRGQQGQELGDAPQHLFTAAAHGGRLANSSGRPRAVLLLLDDKSIDVSDFDLEEVGGYLRTLQVPFFVWLQGLEENLANLPFYVSGDLEAVLREAVASLERQRVVQFEGSLLPKDVKILPGSGWRWAGTGAAAEVTER